ncbi:VCBS repeat-containing protein [Hymenobacter segetis]|uniref:VCBS repeat-containing protein n=1 Tax=Hymenobacter segetis TaxID=2025509 RepID=A0ABU9M148_9BACT
MNYSFLGPLLLAGLAAQAQAPTFAPVVAYPSGGLSPYGLALADVNGDGRPDVVIANTYNSLLGVLLGNGNGTFQPVVTYATGAGTSPRNVVVADVNGDARPDLVFADIQGVGAVGVLLGNGDGTFQAVARLTSAPGLTVDYVAVGDLNGDGRLDVVTASFMAAANGGAVQVLPGNGNGTFQAARAYACGSAFSLALADVNGDGRLDVLTANFFGDSAGVLLGNGDGSLQAEHSCSTGPNSTPYEVAVADVNADGRPDLLTANYGSDALGVLLGNGNGTFQAVAAYSTGPGSTPAGLAAADLNGDGHLDVVTANFGTDALGVLLGTGTGTFQAPLTFATGSGAGPLASPFNVVAADVNGDGQRDLLAANYTSAAAAVLLQTTPLATRSGLPGARATLAPNPAAEHARLALAGLPPAVVAVQATVLDATGRLVGSYALPVGHGAAQAELPTAAWAPGLYIVQLRALGMGGAVVGQLPAARLSVP